MKLGCGYGSSIVGLTSANASMWGGGGPHYGKWTPASKDHEFRCLLSATEQWHPLIGRIILPCQEEEGQKEERRNT
jgi:hypothetical protein